MSCDLHVISSISTLSHFMCLLKQPTTLARKFTSSGTKRLESLMYCQTTNEMMTTTTTEVASHLHHGITLNQSTQQLQHRLDLGLYSIDTAMNPTVLDTSTHTCAKDCAMNAKAGVVMGWW